MEELIYQPQLQPLVLSYYGFQLQLNSRLSHCRSDPGLVIQLH